MGFPTDGKNSGKKYGKPLGKTIWESYGKSKLSKNVWEIWRKHFRETYWESWENLRDMTGPSKEKMGNAGIFPLIRNFEMDGFMSLVFLRGQSERWWADEVDEVCGFQHHQMEFSQKKLEIHKSNCLFANCHFGERYIPLIFGQTHLMHQANRKKRKKGSLLAPKFSHGTQKRWNCCYYENHVRTTGCPCSSEIISLPPGKRTNLPQENVYLIKTAKLIRF